MIRHRPRRKRQYIFIGANLPEGEQPRPRHPEPFAKRQSGKLRRQGRRAKLELRNDA